MKSISYEARKLIFDVLEISKAGGVMGLLELSRLGTFSWDEPLQVMWRRRHSRQMIRVSFTLFLVEFYTPWVRSVYEIRVCVLECAYGISCICDLHVCCAKLNKAMYKWLIEYSSSKGITWNTCEEGSITAISLLIEDEKKRSSPINKKKNCIAERKYSRAPPDSPPKIET